MWSHGLHRLGWRAPEAAETMDAEDGPSRSGDLHFHLLPGVDDGPATMADSLELARAAVADGSATIVATPHVRADFVTDTLGLADRVRELRQALAAEGVPLEVRCGGELGHRMVGRLGQRELEAIAQGPPGGRWLLVEAPFEVFGEDFHLAAEELRCRGFGVVIAHPERSADAELDGGAALVRELRLGSLAQVNALSLTGRHGLAAAEWAFRFILSGRVALIASDAHGPTRPPSLRVARTALLSGGVSEATARTLTLAAPEHLLARGVRARADLAA